MNILTGSDYTHEMIDHLFMMCSDTLEFNQKKILMNAFFEPSTRTSFSFECAMKRLGGEVINFTKDTSSMNKGESFEDTIRTLSYYCDIIVIRHPDVEYIKRASEISKVPIINAGNGNGEHPTQALLDLYTMYKKWKHHYKTKTILFVGDIKNSRTIHSFINLLRLYPIMKIYFLPYEGCGPSEEMLQKISDEHDQNKDEICLHQIVDHKLYDVVYVTRRQKERETHCGITDICIDEEFAEKMHEDAIIMHPLPRNTELCTSVDKNPRNYYFKQMEYGVKIRMTLLYYILFMKK